MVNVYIFDENKKELIDLEPFGIKNCSAKNFCLPGFFDIHVHGGHGYAVFDEDEEKLKFFLKELLKEGVSKILITTLTAPSEKIESYIKWIGEFIKSKPWEKEHMASIEGIHLEGPFININKKGAQNPNHILKPSISLVKKWQKMSNNNIKLLTYAPELASLDFQKGLNELGIIGSCGHTECDNKTLLKFINEGLTHVTHIFNAMPSFHHREPGIIGEAFINDMLNCEIISDGHHVCEKSMQVLLNNVGPRRTQVITDCVFVKGLKDGPYEFEGLEANKKGDVFTLVNGSLAGSISEFNKNTNNIRRLMNWNMNDIVKISSANQLKEILNVKAVIKKMKEGKQEFFLFNDDLVPLFFINKLGVKKLWK